jgi:hypothetical protein
MLRCSLLLAIAACAMPAVSEADEAPPEAPPTTVTVDGATVAVYQSGDEWLAVPASIPARLVRDRAVAPSECAQIETVLVGTESIIERCKLPANATKASCRNLRDIVTMLRFDPGRVGLSSLLQRWSPEAAEPPAEPTVDTIRRAVAEAVGTTAEHVHYRDQVRPAGARSDVRVQIAAGGATWASKLQGVIGLSLEVDGAGAPTATTDAASGQLVTRDHVVACAFASGEAQVAWTEPAAITVSVPVPGPLAGDELWQLYQQLASGTAITELDPIRRAVAVGARIGAALSGQGLAAGDGLVTFALEAFYGGDALELDAALTRAEVDERSIGSAPVGFAVDLGWASTGARL